jgi:DNA-binding Lrp family transcriptional regulator
MINGYIFITAATGLALDVVTEVRKIKGISKACSVAGPYDIIASFEVPELKDIGKVVVKGIHQIEGVFETETAICIP